MQNIIDVIKKAGEIVKEGFYKNKEIRFKGEIDLVTEYDVRVEEYLKEHLAPLMPNHTIIGEETNSQDDESQNKVIIDPIDGTTNFVHQIPFLGISVGIITDGKADIGIVYNPLLDEVYHAKVGDGAYLNGNPIHVTDTKVLKKAMLATGFPYSITTDKSDYEFTVNALAKALKNVRAIRRMGAASYDLCMVAKGSVDIYYEMNLNAWDVSAGIIILQEAGGKVTNEKNEEYTLFKDKYILASNTHLHDQLLTILE
jgi:myo-inositol-1(or 4)-monophosphatase